MLNDRKIIQFDQPVSSLADKPQMTASALKAAFDANTNQVKPALNGLIDDLQAEEAAGEIGFHATAGVQAGTVQAAIEEVRRQVVNTALGEVPDGSIGAVKLADEVQAQIAGALQASEKGARGGIAPLGENQKLLVNNMPPMFGLWKLLQAYTTAGTFTWTAPDLYGDGRPYKVGVVIIGGGGAGGLTIHNALGGKATGGGSGYLDYFILEVTPGVAYSGIVGAKGVGVSRTGTANVAASGGNGGSTSFASRTVNGGAGGSGSIGSSPAYPDSGQPFAITGEVEKSFSSYGGKCRYYIDTVYKTIYEFRNYNPFAMEPTLGVGGCHMNTWVMAAGKNPITGKGAGNAIYQTTSATAESADEAGCGGGAIGLRVSTEQSATSGSGADGAVYLYIPEVVM